MESWRRSFSCLFSFALPGPRSASYGAAGPHAAYTGASHSQLQQKFRALSTHEMELASYGVVMDYSYVDARAGAVVIGLDAFTASGSQARITNLIGKTGLLFKTGQQMAVMVSAKTSAKTGHG